ncbi:MAG TPA: LytTR family transcriptional regulator [Candidatus Faecousia faecipullorum]|nr:LytTR family transcriptional regulator [Candidatus Faecousia faecipullorum]
MQFILRIDPEKEEEVVAQVHKESEFTDKLQALVRQGEGLNTFYGYDEGDIHLLSIEKAEAFFTAEDKTYAVMDDGRRYRIRCRLYELEEKLPAQFIRISKSAIANRRAMARLETQLSGAVNVVFRSGYVDYVSRRCFADMKRRYGL